MHFVLFATWSATVVVKFINFVVSKGIRRKSEKKSNGSVCVCVKLEFKKNVG